MKTRTEFKTTPSQAKLVKEKEVYRALAVRFIRDLPFEDLERLFEFSKVSPYSRHSRRVLDSEHSPAAAKVEIKALKLEGLVLFKAKFKR